MSRPLEFNNIDTCKSYATEDNLMRALKEHGLDDAARPLVVRNRAGRYTAVFAYSHVQGFGVARVAGLGFKVLG